MPKELRSGTADLMQFLNKNLNKKVWFLLASGIVTGILVGVPDALGELLQLGAVTIYSLDEKQKFEKQFFLNVSHIFSWGEGSPSFASPRRGKTS
jgi:hypothetical protein